MIIRGRGGVERALRGLAHGADLAQPRHQIVEGGHDLEEAPGQRAIVREERELHLRVAGGDRLEHGLEANTEEEHGEGITLLDALEALEARGGAIGGGVPEPV